MEIKKTERNFPFIEFKDRYGKHCSLQLSSLADDRCIWFGVDDAEPSIMASQAEQYGIITDQKTGWITYPIPKDVLISTRMHLTMEQVQALLPVLQKFAETGEID